MAHPVSYWNQKLIISLIFLCALMSTPVALHQVQRNDRPIIGILGMSSFDSPFGDEHIESTYVKYLESAGAQVVPVRGKQPDCYYRKLFKQINGVLFPGGHDDPAYARSGHLMYKMAMEANDNSDYFPIWGTCQGFQLLTFLNVGKNVLNHTDSENMTLPLTFAKGFKNSRLFQQMPSDLISYLGKEKITQNEHQFSLLLRTFYETSMSDFYQLLSTNIGRGGKEFVSTMEAKKYPFYGTQWHPEKNMFLWADNQVINHSPHAVKVSQNLANFFVSEARKSQHYYSSSDSLARNIIENFKRIFKPGVFIDPLYFFKYPTNSSQPLC